MSIRDLMRLFLLFCIFLIVFSIFLVKDDFGFLPAITIFYLMFLIYILNVEVSYSTPLVDILVFQSILWIVIRICYLHFRMESVNGYMLSTTPHLAFTMFMVLVSTFSLFIGLKVGERIKYNTSDLLDNNSFRKTTNSKTIKESFLFKYFIFAMVFSLYIFYEKNLNFLQILSFFVSYDFSIILFISYCVFFWEKFSNSRKLFAFVAIIIFVLIRTFEGSKGGIFIAFSLIFTALVALKPSIKFSWRIIFLVLLFGFVSLFLYFIGDSYRFLGVISQKKSFGMSYFFNNFGFVWDRAFNSSLKEALDSISRRLSMLDYLDVMFNKNPKYYDFLGIQYSLKIIWNNIFPSHIFPFLNFSDAQVYPANLFKLSYGNGTYQQVVSNYHSDMLPLFGYLFINFGFFSFIIIFLFGIVCSVGYKYLMRSGIKIFYFYRTLYLLMVSDLCFGMGFAATFSFLFHYIFPSLIVFFFIYKMLTVNFMRAFLIKKC